MRSLVRLACQVARLCIIFVQVLSPETLPYSKQVPRATKVACCCKQHLLSASAISPPLSDWLTCNSSA